MSENPQEQTEAKLLAYLEGELDEVGRAEIERHLESNAKHRLLMDELAAGRRLVRMLPRATAPAELYDNFQSQMERLVLLDGVADPPPPAENVRATRWGQFRAAAAVALLATGLGVMVYNVLPRRTPPRPLRCSPARRPCRRRLRKRPPARGAKPAREATPAASAWRRQIGWPGPTTPASGPPTVFPDGPPGQPSRRLAAPMPVQQSLANPDALRRARMAEAADVARKMPGVRQAVADADARGSDPRAGRRAPGRTPVGRRPGRRGWHRRGPGTDVPRRRQCRPGRRPATGDDAAPAERDWTTARWRWPTPPDRPPWAGPPDRYEPRPAPDPAARARHGPGRRRPRHRRRTADGRARAER
jgi:hypothetical protein